MTRQGFIRALGASCGMFALAPGSCCAALDPKRAAKPLNVNRVAVKVGVSRPFKVMHVSDTHFTFADCFSKTAMTYVVGANYGGAAQMVSFQ